MLNVFEWVAFQLSWVLCAKFENSVQSLGAPAQREKRNADTLDLPLQNDCREKYTYFEDTNITQEW